MVNRLIATTLMIVLYALPAWSVTGNAEITVTDHAGKPLRGKTVTLISTTGTKVTTSETDDSGSVLIPAEEGTYVIEVGEGNNKTRTDVIITGGETTRLTIEVPEGTGVPFDIPPTGIFTYGDENGDDVPLTSSEDRITDIINGTPRPTDVRPGDPNDLNNRFDFSLDWTNAAATFATGVSRIGKFHPFVKGSIGRGDVTFGSNNLEDSSRSTFFEGEGTSFGFGGGGLYVSDDHLIAGGGYLFTGFYDLELTRRNPLQVPGGVVTRDEIEISYSRHQIRLFAGIKTPIVYPYGGIVIVNRRLEIEGITEADFSQTAGFPVVRRVEFTNELKDDTVEGLVGLGFRKGHFLAGIEGSFGSGYTNFLFQAGYGF